MKISTTLSFALLLSTLIQGQDKRSDQQLKQQYVEQQGYLSPNSQMSLNDVYGDSLKGFDEKGLTTALLASGVQSWEMKLSIQYQKRSFINNKYNLLSKSVIENSSQNTATSTGKKKGGVSIVNVAPCVNEGFEQSSPGAYTTATAVTGWTVSSGNTDGTCNYNNSNAWSPGSTEFSLVATPLTNWPFVGTPLTVVPHSPLGGTVVAQLNNGGPGANNVSMTRMKQTFPVLSSNALFQFAYAGYWEDGGAGHNCCQQPGFYVKMFDCSGQPLGCSSISLSPNCSSAGATFSTIANTASWCNWQVKQIDLTAYIGSCVTVEFITTDCSLSGHWGATLLDVACGLQPIGIGIPTTNTINIASGPVSFCAGANVAQICAPAGYQSYQWWSPITGTIMSAPQGTMMCPTIINPLAGVVYTVIMTSASGCIYQATLGLSYSQVNIATISKAPSCPLGASGSATVYGNGSGGGYTYKWFNSSNQVIDTNMVVKNLSPGTYKVKIGGKGASGCGTDSTTVVIDAVATNTQMIFQPYCGSPAYIPTQGGGNIKWYSGTTLITGATFPTYTVSNPSNGAIFWYCGDNVNGCRDSIMFVLVQGQPGSLTVPTNSIKAICPGASNGTAAINLVPSMGAQLGFNTYSVWSTGSTPPFVTTLGPTSIQTFTFGGLSPGSYTVTAFDGSCRYNTNFVITPVTFTYSITPITATLCPGNSIAASIFPSGNANQFYYNWSPTTWFPGNNGNVQQTLLTPAGIPQGGSVTTIYTVVVTPTVAYCPITKTIAITAVNPPTPSISIVPPLCDTFSPYQLQATPGGGTFINSVSTPTLIGTLDGIVTPNLGPFGVHQFTYAINVNTCVATTTATLEISQFFSSALTSTVAPLCVTSSPVNLMNIVQQTQNGTWTGAGVNANTFNPSSLTGGVYTATYNTVSSPNPAACPSSHTLSVNVTNTFVPAITQMQPFCTNAIVRSMTVNPTGGAWSGTVISPSGVITPSNILQVGTQLVNYSIAIGPCINSTNATFEVSRFHDATITGTVQELCFNNPAVNLMNISLNSSFGIWKGPNVDQNNTFSPANLPTGIYDIEYWTSSTPDALLCPDSSMLKISVLNPPQPVIAAAGPFCTKQQQAQLTVTPGGGQWTASSYLGSNGLFTPSLAAVGSNGVEYVIGTATCNSRQMKFISVEAFVSAEISAPSLPDLCNTNAPINLQPYVTNAGGWFGAGINGTTFDPSLAGKGNHVLTHTTASSPSGLCPDQAIVAIAVFSIQTPAIAKLGPFCTVSQPIKLTADVQGGIFDGLNNSAVNPQGLFIPAKGVTGENVIGYTVTSGPCVAYAQSTISVEKFVPADFHTLPPTFCFGDQAINLNHFVFNVGGTWTGPGVNGNMFDPAMANPGTNNEIVYNTWSTPTKSLCPDQRKTRIEIIKIPELTAVANVASGCAPLEVYFSTPNVNNGTAFWVTGDGDVNEKSGLSVSHIYKSPGTYSVVMNYFLKGCKAQVVLSGDIKVYAGPKADFELPEEVLTSDPDVQLVNKSQPLSENRYTWQIAGGNETRSEISPLVTIPAAGRYDIKLVAENMFGCKDEIVKTIQVKNDINVFIPTSFSPNFDGLNDVFKPVFTLQGLDPKSFEMEIFDRWGHSLFRSTDVNKGWDGTTGGKGETLTEGAYVYKIRFKDMDGSPHNKIGHVTILK